MNKTSCWDDPEHFRYSIDFFGIVEVYSEYEGEIIWVEEGNFLHGKKTGLVRYSSWNETTLGWFKDDKRHGRFINVNSIEGHKVDRLIYYEDTLNGTF